MKEVQATAKKLDNITEPEIKFKGYTLEELRYQRALVMLQREFCKSKIEHNLHTLQKSNPFSPSTAAASLPGKAGFIATKLLSGLNYLDYAMLGFTLFGSVRKVFSFFKKNKKK